MQKRKSGTDVQKHLVHPIPPVYDSASKILILGSFPSVKSREQGFFYGHPQNRFWKILAAVFHEEVPVNVEEKKSFLLRNHVALWDVIASCEITGSSDASIRNAEANDLTEILEAADIRSVFVNGRTAEKLYNRYIEKAAGRECICLPSSSPANAAFSLDRLIPIWEEAIRAVIG